MSSTLLDVFTPGLSDGPPINQITMYIGHDFQLCCSLPISPEISVASLNNGLCLTHAKCPVYISGEFCPT